MWLTIPGPLRDAYADMMPRLRAEEDLRAISVAVASAGRELAPADRSKYLSDLENEAAIEPVRAKKATPADLRSMGISVKETVKHG